MPSLTIPPEEIVEIRSYRTLIPTKESGMTHRRSVYLESYPSIRSWRVLWHTATLSEKDTIAQLYADTAGGSLSFNWAPPGEAAMVVRFSEGQFSWQAITPVSFSVSITVEAVR